jgi:monoamine oxidase
MARTPLFSFVRRSLQIASLASRPGGPPVDEAIDRLIERTAADPSRRQFLKTAAGAVAVAASPDIFTAFAQAGSMRPKTAIIGAGIAGLNCAYKLRKARVPVQVFEASSRVGGRMLTARSLLAPGLTTEMGGEFIDSGHEEMLALVKEFGLGMWDFRKPAGKTKKEAFYFDGRHVTEQQVIKAFIPLAGKMSADYDSLGEEVSYRNHGNGKKLDNTSIEEYLEGIGARGWIRELLQVAYVTEYGLEADQQSSLNLIQLIGTDTDSGFKAFGDSDERYTVKGGNERVVEELASRLGDVVALRHRLTAITAKDSGFTLTFDGPSGTAVDRDFETVVLTLPFTMLREVDIRVPLPEVKRRAINQLGYGTNAKVLAGFNARQWRKLGYRGNTLTDEPFQLCWDNGALQPGTSGGITFYSGGRLGVESGNGTAQEALSRLMPGFERAYPGSKAHLNGKLSRFHWPTHAFTKASYACYKPGQWTSIGGAEGESVGNLHFAGEHTSVDFQGYMNGGAQSGADAAKAVLASVSTKAATLFERLPRRMASVSLA